MNLQNILIKLKILTTTQCRSCGQELTPHGWYDAKDCMNETCEKYYYRDFPMNRK